MAEIPEIDAKGGGALETWIGLCVVLLATFLGVANVKDGNIVQQMQLKHADRNDKWGWYQARNIRSTVYDAFADELSLSWPNETPEIAKKREEKSAFFRKRVKELEEKMEKTKVEAERADDDYQALNSKDDQFDLCEAALAIGLALMGVTALVKRWWLFGVALVPSLFGVAMGVAGFMGMDTNSAAINWIVQVLS